MQGFVADLDVSRLPPQAGARAVRTGFGRIIFRQFLAHRHRIGFTVTPLEVGHHTFKHVFAHNRLAAFAGIAERHFLCARPMQNQLPRLIRQFVERHFNVELVMARQANQHLEIKLVAAVPALDRPAGQRQAGVGDNAFRIKEGNLAQAVTFWAGAHGIVERKKARLHFGQRIVTRGTREL